MSSGPAAALELTDVFSPTLLDRCHTVHGGPLLVRDDAPLAHWIGEFLAEHLAAHPGSWEYPCAWTEPATAVSDYTLHPRATVEAVLDWMLAGPPRPDPLPACTDRRAWADVFGPAVAPPPAAAAAGGAVVVEAGSPAARWAYWLRLRVDPSIEVHGTVSPAWVWLSRRDWDAVVAGAAAAAAAAAPAPASDGVAPATRERGWWERVFGS